MELSIGKVSGLGEVEQEKLDYLVDVFNDHRAKNDLKEKYYDGNVTLNDVNLGIALPNGMQKMTVGCDWGCKAVDVLAAHSMFDGFVSANGTDIDTLNEIMDSNRMTTQYIQACKDELKFGCVFATLSRDENSKCKIRFHSTQTASARWDGSKGKLDSGMAIIDTVPDESEENTWTPSHINLYTDDAIWELRKGNSTWYAEKHPHIMGIPLMVAMVWNATSSKPFGRSRLKQPVRALIDEYVRTIANATIALEFDTTPQKYILGVTDEQYDEITSDKFKQYVGSIIASTVNPETGQNPSFGQLPQGSLTPHVEMLRMVATQFSAATGLTVTDTGVVNNANPTSSEAIIAQSQTLILLAEQLNRGNGDALNLIARMALAMAGSKSLKELSQEENDVIAHFKNPAMPSVSVTADAAIKIASSRQGFAETDTFLSMIGFDQAEIRRIKAQERRARGINVADEVTDATN